MGPTDSNRSQPKGSSQDQHSPACGDKANISEAMGGVTEDHARAAIESDREGDVGDRDEQGDGDSIFCTKIFESNGSECLLDVLGDGPNRVGHEWVRVVHARKGLQ